ncbi:hypothetical protein F4553_000117 [Allocatelliglobosispora scoriae]|uniref:Long-chain-fatty-acyl-CoA reductase n=1 Tax=Allocatelliglobosispora scoriae TaxID=643052 RepID=A0A841BHE2_9ACTN|nr:acyl-CoA reductase [Allocatelliglobosispora scoriae]MBB5866738.1 hypothetical protein [Allocatelliglobosispora scoriae]
MIRQLFPSGPPVTAADLVHSMRSSSALSVGDDRIVDFFDTVGRILLDPAIARSRPELAALGAFLRRGRTRAELARVGDEPGLKRFPRGLVLHIAPANVDALYVYSWALSALAGNHNVVRVSSRAGEATTEILRVLHSALDSDGSLASAIGPTQRIVAYDHDDAINETLAAACDLRVLWGGDRSIAELRGHSLAPSARDLTFPDRSSFAVINAERFGTACESAQSRVAGAFHADSYWYDQAACASPRTVFWVGSPAVVAAAQEGFYRLLADVVATRGPAADPAMAIHKRVSTYGLAVAGAATAIQHIGHDVTVVYLAGTGNVPRDWLGAGVFPQVRLDSLTELVELVERRDQTLTYYGFEQDELAGLARDLGGRGIDRIVPIGRALEFTSRWDGYDLLSEFTRITTVS